MARALRSRQAKQMFGSLKRQIRPALASISYQKFNKAKEILFNELRDHPISQDLNSHGPSRFLDGAGSLFGFLGFDQGDQPVDELAVFLNSNLNYVPQTSLTSRGLFNFSVSIPNKNSLEGLVKLRWIDVPWPVLIEEGISNLPFFLSKSGKGYSGEGIQVDTAISNITYMPPAGGYLTLLFANFRKNLLIG